jgi:hypothetical protein
MSTAILTCNLGNFDTPVDPVPQVTKEPYEFHRFDDDNFKPIEGLTPRFQYRIPKMFGWQMFPGFTHYIWLDGSVSLMREDSVEWFLDALGDADMALFKHPYRKTIQEEVDHIETYLNRRAGTKRGQDYLINRYENGLHKEQWADIQLDADYIDDKLYASTAFIYKDSEAVRDFFRLWWLHQSRYWTVDQIALPYVARNLWINVINENPFKGKYVSKVSDHR